MLLWDLFEGSGDDEETDVKQFISQITHTSGFISVHNRDQKNSEPYLISKGLPFLASNICTARGLLEKPKQLIWLMLVTPVLQH